MQSFFPTSLSGGHGAVAAGPSAPLVQIKAGKCVLTPQPDGKYLVTADSRRGKISLIRNNDGLIHFRWENRVTGEIEDDRIIFPSDATLRRVQTGPQRAHDRVYVLLFQSGTKLMYWLQDLDSSKDEELINKLNDLINNPRAATTTAAGPAGSSRTGAAAGASAAATGGLDFSSLTSAAPAAAGAGGALGNLDLSSLLSSFAAGNSSSVPAAQPAVNGTSSSGNNGRLTAAHLQQALAGAAAAASAPVTNLGDVLSTDAITSSGILNDPAVRDELVQHLPEGQRVDELLEDNLRSPQFQQSLGALSEALQSDGSIAASFGINPSPGTAELIRGDGVGAFLTSLQAATDAEQAAVAAAAAPADTSSSDTAAAAPPQNPPGDDTSKMEE